MFFCSHHLHFYFCLPIPQMRVTASQGNKGIEMKISSRAMPLFLMLMTLSGHALASSNSLSGRITFKGDIVESPCELSGGHANLLVSCWVNDKNLQSIVNLDKIRTSKSTYSLDRKGVSIQYFEQRDNNLLYKVHYH